MKITFKNDKIILEGGPKGFTVDTDKAIRNAGDYLGAGYCATPDQALKAAVNNQVAAYRGGMGLINR